MYRIGMFSKISKTTIKTLRYYDSVGLLVPALIDQKNGYRYYTSAQLIKLHQIISLKQIGFSIDQIQALITQQDVGAILEKRKSEIILQHQALTDQLSRIQHYINEEGYRMHYQVIIKQLSECIVYSKRMIVPNYAAYFELIPAIGVAIKKANPRLKCALPEYCFIIYHNDEYKDKDIDVEYCEAVTEIGVNTTDITFKTIPACLAVSVLHKGAYKDLNQAYAYAFKWLEDNGYIMIDHPRESYIDGIWNKENVEDWLTELQIPVTKKQ